MSIRKLVAEKIERLRGMIAVWDNPDASQEEKGKVLATLLGKEPKFWAEVAKRASAPKRDKKVVKIVKTAEAVQVKPEPVAVQKATISTVARPTPARPGSVTAPPRKLRDQKPVATGTSVFAAKLNGAAEEVGLEDHTPLGKFRTLLKMKGRQSGQYWKELRDFLEVCLREKLIQEVSDWKLLVAKMKEEPFVSGKKGEAFLAQCPKEGIEDLLLADDGLWRIVEALRTEGEINDNTPFHIGFMLDACLIVGKEAKELLVDCKQAVNHMKQTRFIPRDHWLVQKVAAMKAPTPPQSVSPVSETPTNEAATDHKLEKLQQVAEATAAEVPAEKPETLGPVADAQFEAAMMAAAGEVIQDVETMSEAELEKLTAPTLAVN